MVWFSGDVSNSSKIGLDDLGGFSSLNEFVILQTWDSSDRVSVGRDGKEGVEPVPGSWLPQGSFTSLLLQVLPPQEQQQQNFDLDLIHTPSSPNSSAHPPHPPFTQALGQEPGGTLESSGVHRSVFRGSFSTSHAHEFLRASAKKSKMDPVTTFNELEIIRGAV